MESEKFLLNECIFACNADTQKVLYVNQSGLALLSDKRPEEVVGKKCYEVLAGRTEPCTDCQNAVFSQADGGAERQYHRTDRGHYYQIRDCLLKVGEKRVRLNVVTDVTQFQEARQRLEELQETEKIVNECLKVLHASIQISQDIEEALHKLGDFLQCGRTYIFINSEDKTKNIFEWCAAGVQPEKENLQEVPLREISRWTAAFERGESIIIEDLEEIRELAPEEYERLAPQDIQSLVAVPLRKEKEVWGYLGADNVAPERLKYSEMILEILAFFFSARLLQQQNHEIMKQLSYTDALTGVFNRNAYVIDLESEYKHSYKPMGVVFIDVNQLKNVNDTLGHRAGDDRIRGLAQEVKRIFGKDRIYRIGGDEFVVICQGGSEAGFEGKVACLRLAVQGGVDTTASIGACFVQRVKDVEDLIEEADRQMYREKEHYRKTCKEIL